MRTPLRPLARILQAREDGLNPDSIERENLRLRHEATREKSRSRAQFRLFILCASFVAAFTAIGGRMGMMAATEPIEPRASAPGAEILALSSLPTFDPNDRPNPLVDKTAEPGDSPLFNRAVQGVYELGSTFKIFAVAQAMELGLVNPESMVDANAPMIWGKHKIKEFENHNYGPLLSVTDVIAKSSNVGTAHIALMIGPLRQQAFLKGLGFFEPTSVELIEAPGARPLIPKRWPEIVTITTSYGHGLSASPMHLAAAYAAIANGGVMIKPTLLKREGPTTGVRVMSEKTARDSVAMLRRVVTEGTASLGEVPGYEVAGKTGTADKPRKSGGYYKDKVVNTFASVFPASNPQYVLIVTLDEPMDTTLSEPRRTAGWTAVPVAAEIIRRVAPLMGLRPKLEPALVDAVTAASN